MIYELPIFRQIREDVRLSKRALQMWCIAIEHLDLLEVRPMPWELLEIKTGIARSTLHRVGWILVDHGYLVRHEMADAEPAFRVPLSRVPKNARAQNPHDQAEQKPALDSDATIAREAQMSEKSRRRARKRGGVLSEGVF